MSLKTGNNPKFLIETALLTHGLKSIDDAELISNWIPNQGKLAWIDKGKIVIGSLEQYIPFRRRADQLIRIDGYSVDKCCDEGLSGTLTASGTMKVAAEMEISLAVTCGMGGIGDIKGEEFCCDLWALKNIPVTLIATSPKDMLNIEDTIKWLLDNDVRILGKNNDTCSGFVFDRKPIRISGIYNNEKINGKMLLLNEIFKSKRIKSKEILYRAIEAGKRAEHEGKYYHPAANEMIDVLSNGQSSKLQLNSLIANIVWADKLVIK